MRVTPQREEILYGIVSLRASPKRKVFLSLWTYYERSSSEYDLVAIRRTSAGLCETKIKPNLI